MSFTPATTDRDHEATSNIEEQSLPSITSPNPRIQFTENLDDHLEKLLECPVCYDVILPPVLSCVSGHSCCESCRAVMNKCPLCRSEMSSVRNLFAEQLLEKCRFMCKHGCSAFLPAKELVEHYKHCCPFRPIHCRECDRSIPYEDYIQHVERVDKLERQKASECSTGFEIDEEDLVAIWFDQVPSSMLHQRRFSVWEPTWMNCYGLDFFCSLEFNGEHWWLWISSLTDEGCAYKGQIILWNKEQGAEYSYFGTIHPIRADPNTVLQSGECLILTKKSLKTMIFCAGIDVLVRIERSYTLPKTRKGDDVQSPLDLKLSGAGGSAKHSRKTFPVPMSATAAAGSAAAVAATPATPTLPFPLRMSRVSSDIFPFSFPRTDTQDVDLQEQTDEEPMEVGPGRDLRFVTMRRGSGRGEVGPSPGVIRVGRGYRHAQRISSRRIHNAELIDLTEFEE